MEDMKNEILTAAQMRDLEALAANDLDQGTYSLMLNAGRAVVDVLLNRFGEAEGYDVLCGPGNNGGDGYVIATLLREAGLSVQVHALGAPSPDTDAARACSGWEGDTLDLANWQPKNGRVVVDAIFGAGLSRNVEGAVLEAIGRAEAENVEVIAVDLPTGIEADTGAVLGAAFTAMATVTFCRPKPAHVMAPGAPDVAPCSCAISALKTDTFLREGATYR